MKLKFETFYRGLMLFLLVSLFWGIWAAGQTNTNTPAATNASATATEAARPASGLVAEVEKLNSQQLTFGLDRVPWLKDRELFGEPLWKYLASLIFIFLAFYISKLIDF